MSRDTIEERFTAALERALAGAGSGAAEVDAELRGLLGTAAYLRETLTPVPASEPFRGRLREWLERPPRRRWWEDLLGEVRRRLPVPARRPAIGIALGAGAAAAIVIGVLMVRNRRAAAAGAAG